MADVIDIKRPEKWRNAVEFLRNLADKLEKGEVPEISVGVMGVMLKSGALVNYGFGPDAEDLLMVAVASMSHHCLLSDMTGV